MDQENLFIVGGGPDVTFQKNEIDIIVSFYSEALSWSYDINDRSMSFYHISEDNITRTLVIKNYRQSAIGNRLISSEDEGLFDVFCAELDAGKDNIVVEFRGPGREYDIAWWRYMGMTTYDEDGRPLKVLGRAYDISREKMIEVETGNGVDSLTGLTDKERARESGIESIANKENTSAAVIVIDIDDFHLVNEAYGKMQGDTILQTISGLIYTNFMPKDTVGRVAGDQFVVFCANLNQEKLVELLDNLNERIRANVPKIDERSITVSIGVALSPNDGKDYDILYTKADLALAKAKKEGKNQYRFYSLEECKYITKGYTLEKLGKFEEDQIRITKISSQINKKLFDFAFEELSKGVDIKDSIHKIFAEVCLFYGLDRALIHEYDVSHDSLSITTAWSRIDDKGDTEKNIDPMNMLHWGLIEDVINNSQNDGYLVMHNGRGNGLDFFREIITLSCPPVDAVYVPIIDNSTMVAMVVFDAFVDHVFTKNELATLNSIVRLIRSYLLSNQVKYELKTESVINKNVMDAQRIIYYIVDELTYEVKYLSKYARNIYPNAEYGKKCYETLMGYNEPCEVCPLRKGFGPENSIETYNKEFDKWFTFSANKMQGTDNEHDVLICITDVTEFLTKVRSEDTLTVADSYDSFVPAATKAIMNHDKKYTIISVGIQRFAKINDVYGYVVGDEILKRLAVLMKEDIAEGELFCRIKGDDFACLVASKSEEQHKEYVTKYTEILNREFKQRFASIDIKIFVGCYEIGEDDQYINKCMDHAIKARNYAMDNKVGDSRLLVYNSDMERKEKEEDNANRLIVDALRNDRFTVFFQPKVDISDSSIVGAEALVRMKDVDGKLVSPGMFIPQAEKNGMIREIDNVVYEKTFEFMRKWIDEGKKVPLVSVNVSRLNLVDDDFPSKIKELSEKFNLDPSQIELEITESVFFQDAERLIDMIIKLKSYGFVISMDDFGSGYSTLNFMKTLPVDVIKIDGGFFMRNEMDKKSKAVISAIMQLTENLDFKMVSEGVETKEQVEFIREQGGRCVQGYYFYKPLPAEEFEALLY